MSLDAQAGFSFAWSLPAGEVGPELYKGNTPTFDSDTLYPFSNICGAVDELALYSCKPEQPLTAGTHYAFLLTRNNAGRESSLSPVTSFTVPVKLGWGCGPKLGPEGCGEPQGLATGWVPHPSIGVPSSTLGASAWLNNELAPVTFSFTIRQGRRVLLRFHEVALTREFNAESGLELTHAYAAFSGDRHGRWHAARGGSRLSATIVITGGGQTLTRTTTMKAPAARG